MATLRDQTGKVIADGVATLYAYDKNGLPVGKPILLGDCNITIDCVSYSVDESNSVLDHIVETSLIRTNNPLDPPNSSKVISTSRTCYNASGRPMSCP